MSEMCGKELKEHNVTCVSLWPGLVQTENLMAAKDQLEKGVSEYLGGVNISRNVIIKNNCGFQVIILRKGFGLDPGSLYKHLIAYNFSSQFRAMILKCSGN